MAILRQHRQNKKIQSVDNTTSPNGTILNADSKHTDTKEERIITSGGVPKNGMQNFHSWVKVLQLSMEKQLNICTSS